MQPREVKTAAQARQLVEASGASHVKIGVFDLDGILRGKYLSREKFFSGLEKGLGFCDVVLGWDSNDQLYDNVTITGWHTGYPDAHVRILPQTCRELPFEPGTFFSSASSSRPRDAVCPRGTLRRVLERARAMGLQAFAGLEYEFFVFEETPASVREKHYRNLVPLTPGYFGYSVLRNSVHSRVVSRAARARATDGFSDRRTARGNRCRRARGCALRRRGGCRGRQGGALQDVHQGLVPASRPHGDLHGQMVARLARSERTHPYLSARSGRQVGVPRSAGAARHECDHAPLPRRPAAPAAGAPRDDRADCQFLSPSHTRLLGADRLDLGRGEPDLRAALRARQPELPAHGSTDSPPPTPIRIWRSPPLSPRASTGSSTGWSPTRPCAAMRTSKPFRLSSRSAHTLGRRAAPQTIARWRAVGSAMPSSTTMPRRGNGRSGSSARRSRIGSWRATSRSSDRTHHVEAGHGLSRRRPPLCRARRTPALRKSMARSSMPLPRSTAGVTCPSAERAAHLRAVRRCLRGAPQPDCRRDYLADRPTDRWCTGRGARHRRESPLHDRCRRRCAC